MGKEAKYVVRLSQEERESLETVGEDWNGAADKGLRAQLLLKADVSDRLLKVNRY